MPFKVVETKKPALDTAVAYRDLDRPTVMRNQQAATAAVAREVAKPAPLAEKDMEYLDIPAFLRRQAD